MRLIRNLSELPPDLRGGAVTIGNFDGVHLGHAAIVNRLLQAAQEVGGASVVFTFEPHPVRILRPDAVPPPLTWTERKAHMLARLGVDAVVAYPTDEQLLALSPEQFFERIVRQTLDARAMVEGVNFYFGRDRAGHIRVLQQLCGEAQIDITVVQPVRLGELVVSSSRIRQALQQGQAAEAAQMLGRPYRLRGMVTHGAGRGARIGFATANLDAIDTLIPAHGVYAGQAIVDGRPWAAAVNVGPSPTFGESIAKVEAHLIGFDGALYGQPLEVDFLKRLRNIQTFSGVEQLKAQLRRDVAAAREACEAAER